MDEWGVDMALRNPGGLKEAAEAIPNRKIYLLQRKTSKPGAGLGKTTGWIHRAVLKRHGVIFLSGVEYVRVEDEGLVIFHEGQERLLTSAGMAISDQVCRKPTSSASNGKNMAAKSSAACS